MVLYDFCYAFRSIRDLLGIRNLGIGFLVDFERRFEVTVIIGRIDSREVQLHNEFMKLRLRNAIRSHFPISIQPASQGTHSTLLQAVELGKWLRIAFRS